MCACTHTHGRKSTGLFAVKCLVSLDVCAVTVTRMLGDVIVVVVVSGGWGSTERGGAENNCCNNFI